MNLLPTETGRRSGLKVTAIACATCLILFAGGCAPAHDGQSMRPAAVQRRLNRDLTVAAYRADVRAVRDLLAAGAWGDAPFGGTNADRRAAFAAGPGRVCAAR